MNSSRYLHAASRLLLLACCCFLKLTTADSTVYTTATEIVDPAGKTLNLPCSSESNRTLQWLKGEQLLAEKAAGSDEVNVFGDGGGSHISYETESDFALYIDKTRLTDAGNYFCQEVSERNATLVIREYQVLLTAKLPPPPSAPTVTALGPLNISVEWPHSVRNSSHHPVEEYVILVSESTEVSDWNGNGVEEVNVDGSLNHTVINGLHAYTVYTVAVKAWNRDGTSDVSKPSKPVRTNSALPSTSAKPTIDIVQIGTQDIYIEFRPPRRGLNGPLDGYIFAYWPTGNLKGGRIMKSVIDPLITNYTFAGLIPFTGYMITVAAITGDYETKPDDRFAKTEPDVPGLPHTFYIFNRTHNSVCAAWSKPEFPNGELLGYTVYWSVGNMTWNDTVLVGGKMSYKIEGLNTYEPYSIEMDAFNMIGHGPKTKEYIGRTDVVAPGAPTLVNVTVTSATRVRVYFLPPTFYYGQIDLYNIQYCHDDQSCKLLTLQGRNLHASPQDVSITNLTSDTEYRIRVAAVTVSLFYSANKKQFVSEYSSVKTVRTLFMQSAGGGAQPVATGVVAGIIITSIMLVLAIAGFVFMRYVLGANTNEAKQKKACVSDSRPTLAFGGRP